MHSRKVQADTCWGEVVACKEEAHREGRAEYLEICTEDWLLQAAVGMCGSESMVHVERKAVPVHVAEDVADFAGSPPTLAGAGVGVEIEAPGCMAGDGWDPLAAAVSGNEKAQ